LLGFWLLLLETMHATLNDSSPLSILTHMSVNEVPMVKTLSGGLAVILAAWMVGRWVSTRNHKYPPGPRGWPLIGNILELRGDLWLTFTKWKNEFGKNLMFCLNLVAKITSV
jgi:hypothetical protein